MPNPPPPSGIQVLRRAASVLRAVGEQPGSLRLVELAAHLDLPKTTAHRIVTALAEEELLRVDPRGHLWLGPGIAALARAGSMDLAGQLRPVLDDLARTVDETVDLSVLDGAAVRFVDQIPSRHRLRAVSTVGASFPAHCTANGKALLAALPQARVDALHPRRPGRCTEHTIVERAALHRELDAVRVDGVALDHEEHTLGIAAIAVAVSDPAGPVAAISVPMPAERFAASEPRLRAALLSARDAAEAILGA